MKQKLMMILAAVAAIFAASAQTYTLTSGGSGSNSAWTDAQYWQDSNSQPCPAGVLDPTGEYRVPGGYALKVPSDAAAFTGGSIRLNGANAFLYLYAPEVTVAGGIDLAQGYIAPMASAVLNADIRTGHWNKNAFLTGPNGSGYSLTVNGDISANYTGNNPDDYYRQWFVFQPYNDGQLLYVNLNGDINDANIMFKGRAGVSDDAEVKSGIIVTMGGASGIGTLRINTSAWLKAKSATDVINAGKLDLTGTTEFKYWPKVDVKNGNASRIVVADSYIASANAMKIRIHVTGDAVYTAAGETDFTLLKMPSAAMPALSDFELSHDPSWTSASEFLIVDNGDGTKSLTLRFTPTVEHTAADASSVDEIADLDLSAFAAFRYNAVADGAAGTASRLSAATSFNRGTAPFEIHLAGDPIDYSAAQATRRYELLVVPSSAELDASTVVFTHESPWAIGVATGVGASQLEPGRKCFYAEFAPMVKLVVSDTGGHNRDTGTTALRTDDPNAASPWSDGLWPHEGADYVVKGAGTTLRTWTQYRLGSWTFPGSTLTIADGARFVNLICDDLGTAGINANLRLAGGIIENATSTDAYFHGNVEAVAGTVSRVECGHSREIRLIDGALTGSGDLVFAGTQQCYTWTGGKIKCDLDKSAFGGRIRVLLDGGVMGSPSSSNFVEYTLGGTLGAALPEFTADAFDLSEMTKVVPLASIDVPAASNRGLKIADDVFFAPGEGVSVSFGTPVVNNGTLHLSGAGTLALAGAMTSAANAAVAVDNGTLRLAGADAVKGSRLSFAAGTALELVINGGDAALAEKGIDLGDLAEPIVLDGSFGGKLPLAVVNAGGKGDFSTALFTCSAAAAASVRAMLPAAVKLSGFLAAELGERTDGETGRVTFFIGCRRPGLSIIFR